MLSRKLLASVIAALVGAPMLVSADSDVSVGPAGTQAAASLDFQIVIPDFVYFQVGTPGAGNVDLVDFDLLTAAIEPGTLPVPATGGTGDGADGDLTVVLITNVANVTIQANGGNLTSGGDTIPFSEISATDSGAITVPAFGGGSVNVATAGPSILNDTWTFEYQNDVVFVPGSYTGTATYTVTTL
jgi:hypothetical protein